MSAKVRYARSDDVSIAYVDLPGGPADVVLVSGFVTNVSKVDVIDTWIPHARRFARVVALDLRGHGLSEHRDAYRYADYEADLFALIDGLGLDLVGRAAGNLDQLAAVGLADIDVQRPRHHDGVQERPDRLGDRGLQRKRADREADAGHGSHQRGPAGRAPAPIA